MSRRARTQRLNATPRVDALRGRYARPLRLEPLEDRRLLAGVVVGNNTDVVNGNVTSISALIATPGADGISLREAIAAANVTGGADVITFAPAMSGGSVILGGTELSITESLTIDARPLAASVAINANQRSRVLSISAGATNVLLGGLLLTGGSTNGNGGGISSLTTGSLTLDECTVRGNAISERSFTAVSLFGGGIFARNVTLTNSTVSSNTVFSERFFGNNGGQATAAGGGIYADNVVISDSTISDNVANARNTYVADPLPPSSFGGGISATSLTLIQSTVSNNRTVTEGEYLYVDLIPGARSGGVDVNNAIINGSILSGNLANGQHNNASGSLTVNFSLIGTGVVPTGGAHNVATDNPQIGPLSDNGGATQTHALLAGSAAVNAGDPSVLPNGSEFDQRGTPFVRVVGGRIDIGAVESPFTNEFIVDTVVDEDDGNQSPGNFSLREAIIAANNRAGADTILFASNLSGQTISLTLGQLSITNDVTIDARSLDANVVIQANNLSRVFRIASGSGNAVLGGLTLTGGRTTAANDPGGAIRSDTAGRLTLYECLVIGNHTEGVQSGGGGVSTFRELRLSQSTVTGNFTLGLDADGGGVRSDENIVVTQSTIAGNQTFGDFAEGGGLRSGTNLDLTDSTVSGNITSGGYGSSGGGMFSDGSIALTQTTVSGNQTFGASGVGGGICLTGGGLTVIRSTITDNRTAQSAGGAVYRFVDGDLPWFILGSILAGNGMPFGIEMTAVDQLTVAYSLIGTTIFPTSGGNNVVTDFPLLGPLADNGGPTRTHLPLEGTPGTTAVNAGDPNVLPLPGQYDQRGTPYVRVADGRIDIGAVERQVAVSIADFDNDADIDGADFLAWQRGLGSTGATATRAKGNADGDADVDGADLAVWKAQFGQAATPAATASVVATGAAAADAALTMWGLPNFGSDASAPALRRFRPARRPR